MFGRLFLDHPRSVQESYLAHFRSALGFALAMFACAIAAVVHAVVPRLFEKTASRTVARLYDRMIVNRVAKRVEQNDSRPPTLSGQMPCDAGRSE